MDVEAGVQITTSGNTVGTSGKGSVTMTWRRYGFDGMSMPTIAPTWSA